LFLLAIGRFSYQTPVKKISIAPTTLRETREPINRTLQKNFQADLA